MPRFGVWDLVHARAGVEPADLYAQHLAKMELAESLGFAEYWLSEHIFHREHSLLPSPGLILAAASSRVPRLELGVLVYVLPFHDPLRLAASARCWIISPAAASGRASAAAPPRRVQPHPGATERVAGALRGSPGAELRLWREDRVDHDGTFYHAATPRSRHDPTRGRIRRW